jgi:aryl-alcohol dehydrogenase-like predicted oxidoreductase
MCRLIIYKQYQSAINRGINFLDNSNDYNDGQSEMRMGTGIQGRRDEVFLMTKHNFRDKKSALRDLEVRIRTGNPPPLRHLMSFKVDVFWT